jgi:hypothetical protein
MSAAITNKVLPPLSDEWDRYLDDEVIDLIAEDPESVVAKACLKVIFQADMLIGLLADVSMDHEIRHAAARQCSVHYFG